MVFPVVIYGCESWTMKMLSIKELMLLNFGFGEDSWESLGQQGDSNQSIVKEISPEYSLEGLMMKLRLQYTGHLMRRTDSLEKTLMLGKNEGRRRRGWQRMRRKITSLTQWTWIWANSGRQWRTGKPGMLQSMGSKRVGHDFSGWTTATYILHRYIRVCLHKTSN